MNYSPTFVKGTDNFLESHFQFQMIRNNAIGVSNDCQKSSFISGLHLSLILMHIDIIESFSGFQSEYLFRCRFS